MTLILGVILGVWPLPVNLLCCLSYHVASSLPQPRALTMMRCAAMDLVPHSQQSTDRNLCSFMPIEIFLLFKLIVSDICYSNRKMTDALPWDSSVFQIIFRMSCLAISHYCHDVPALACAHNFVLRMREKSWS